MNRALLIYFTIFLGVAFRFTPRGVMFDPFLLVDHQVHVEDFAYYLWQHAIMILLMHIIQVEAHGYPSFYRWMFWFQILDVLDYWATNNCIWITVDGRFLQQKSENAEFLTMNMVGAVVGFIFLIVDIIGHKKNTE